jgi:hypothetical protein
MQAKAAIEAHPPATLAARREGPPPATRRLLELARELLRAQLPGATEQVDHAASLITYGFGPELADLACVIRPCGLHIELGFYNGRSLHDRSGLLKPWTTSHRVTRVGSPQDLQHPPLLDLLAQVRARHREPRHR